mgnify:CR=1 FL=1
MRIKFIFDYHDFLVGVYWSTKNHTLYIFPIPMFGMRIRIWGRRCYVVRKRGMFYRAKANGYTNRIEEAGRYTFAEAKHHEYPHDEPVTMHHIKEFVK